MVSSEYTWHVSRVQKRVSKFVNFKVQKVQKPELFDLTDNGSCFCDARGLICHIPHLCTIFLSNNVGLGPCDWIFVYIKVIQKPKLKQTLTTKLVAMMSQIHWVFWTQPSWPLRRAQREYVSTLMHWFTQHGFRIRFVLLFPWFFGNS